MLDTDEQKLKELLKEFEEHLLAYAKHMHKSDRIIKQSQELSKKINDIFKKYKLL